MNLKETMKLLSMLKSLAGRAQDFLELEEPTKKDKVELEREIDHVREWLRAELGEWL